MVSKIRPKDIIHSQFLVFLISLSLFFVAAWFGWQKLHYGFNFLDEGYFMTESWRVASLDRLFQDEYYGSPFALYTALNAIIFNINMEITLLEFRKLQYFFTMTSLLLIGAATIKFDKQYWFPPLVFSLFAFTGLLPWGVIPNLNYYTYCHFFLVLHASFLLLGLYQKGILVKRLFYALSGLAIWGASFSLLHTSIVILSPVFLFIICKKLKIKAFSITLIDLCYFLVPFFVAWAIFVGIYQEAVILSFMDRFKDVYNRLDATRSNLDWFSSLRKMMGLKCMAISLVYLGVSFWMLRKLPMRWSISCLAVLALLMLLAIRNLFHPLDIVIPLWFSSLLVSFLIVFWFEIARRYFMDHVYSKYEAFCIVLLIPSTILSFIMSLFSFNGLYNVMLSSIPIIAAISIYILHETKIKSEFFFLKWVVLVLFFLPFYYGIIWYNLNIPFFDAPPFSPMSVEIEDGFGKGIKTLPENKVLHKAIITYTEKYAGHDDFIIAFPDVPMVHMIARRRPSFTTSWISFTFRYPEDLYEEQIRIMKDKGRVPKLAFIFPDRFIAFNENLPQRVDPVTMYISENMVPLANVTIGGQLVMRCFIDRKSVTAR